MGELPPQKSPGNPAIRAIQLDLNAVNIQALIIHESEGKSRNKTKSVVWPVSVA